jgi:DNA-binding NarL/FixJ family response regulator
LLKVLSEEPIIQTLVMEHLSDSQFAGRKRPHVFIVTRDPSPLGVGGLLKHLGKLTPGARVLLLSERPVAKSLLTLIGLGICGFVEFGETEKMLIPAIRAVSEGRIWIQADSLAQSKKPGHQRDNPIDGFTPQQKQIVDLVRRGLSNKQIAPELGISARTVKFHLTNIFRRLGINDRHLVSQAIGQHEAQRVELSAVETNEPWSAQPKHTSRRVEQKTAHRTACPHERQPTLAAS